MKLVILSKGGEGGIYLSRLIAKVFSDKPIIGSEIHGMAKKGGLVEIHLKIGDYKSPIVGFGKADLVILLNEQYFEYGKMFCKQFLQLSKKEKENIVKINPKMLNIYMFGKFLCYLNMEKGIGKALLTSQEQEFFDKGYSNGF